MTKYVLHGGRTSVQSEGNNNFFKEIIRDLKNPIKILLIYFARDESEWNKLFDEDKDNFNRANPNNEFIVLVASKDLDELKKQISEADVIYMRGGETAKLQEQMSKIKDLKSLFKGKVVVGSSAGAYILSKYYFNNGKRIIKKGLTLLPIKTFCHYTEDQKDILEELKNYKENLKIYTIPEQKFIVIKE